MLIASSAFISLLVWIGTAPRRDPGAGQVRSAGVARGEADALVQSEPSPAATESAAAIAHGPDEVQICGGAWVKTAPDGSVDQGDLERAARVPQARAAILAKLNAAPGEMAKVAGMLMAAVDHDERRRAALIGLPVTCEGAECAAVQAAEAEAARLREAITRVALASEDPKLYALALKVCNRSREGACQLLSAQQLARLDPGNASPWLQILDEAAARKDAAAQAEALYRIANAKRNEVGWLALTGEVLKVVPTDDDRAALADLTAAFTVLGVEVAWTGSGYLGVSQMCRLDAVRDANRAQVCAGVANVLAEHSDTVMGRNIGGSIGTRVGWPAERLQQMRGEYNAYIDSFAADSAEPGAALGCARMHRELDRLRKTATFGEVGAMREWVVHSGKKPEDFIREERTRQQTAQQVRADAAGSAAASASR